MRFNAQMAATNAVKHPILQSDQRQNLFLTSRAEPEKATKRRKRPVRLPSTPTPPERPKARPRKGGVQIIATLYTVAAQKPATAAFAGRSRVKKDLTVGCRGYCSSTRVGSVAPLGNTKEDEYYRNDSLKYCRHEEKKEKKIEMKGGGRSIYRHRSGRGLCTTPFCRAPPHSDPSWMKFGRKRGAKHSAAQDRQNFLRGPAFTLRQTTHKDEGMDVR